MSGSDTAGKALEPGVGDLRTSLGPAHCGNENLEPREGGSHSKAAHNCDPVARNRGGTPVFFVPSTPVILGLVFSVTRCVASL